MQKALHPREDVEILYMSRKEGERDIENGVVVGKR